MIHTKQSRNYRIQTRMSDQQIQSQTHSKTQSFQDWAEENCRAIEKAAKFFHSKAYKFSYEECKQEALILAWKCWKKQDDTRAKLTTYYFYSVKRMWTNLARLHQRPKFKKLWGQIPISEDTGEEMQITQPEKPEFPYDTEKINKYLHKLTPFQREEVDRYLGRNNSIRHLSLCKSARNNLLRNACRVLKYYYEQEEVA